METVNHAQSDIEPDTNTAERDLRSGQRGKAPQDRQNEQKVRERHPLWASFAIALSTVVLSFFCLLVSYHLWRRPLPSFGDTPLTLYLKPDPPKPPPPPPQPPDQITYIRPILSIYFTNGSDRLGDHERRQIGSFGAALRGCPPKRIQVYGSASSVPFRGKSDEDRNVKLAHRRALGVAAELHLSNAELNPIVETITQVRRRFSDERRDGKTPNPVEYLNRRADVVLEGAACEIVDPPGAN